MRSRILSPPEIQKIRAASGPELRDVIDMGFNTLLRLKDLKRLTLKNVNQANNSLEGIQAKTGKPYSIPINREIRKIIDKALRQGRQMLLNCPNFRKEFEAMREGLPILYFQFRDIRRTGARYLLKNGVDLATVQGMLGHADIEMTQIYIQPEHKDKKKASQKLGGIIA
jgi:integrase